MRLTQQHADTHAAKHARAQDWPGTPDYSGQCRLCHRAFGGNRAQAAGRICFACAAPIMEEAAMRVQCPRCGKVPDGPFHTCLVAPEKAAEPTPAQNRWQRGEERKLNDLVCAELRRRGIPHVVARTDRESTIRVGWPDITALSGGRGCCVELKTAGGVVTQKQREVHDELRAAGVPVLVAYSFDEAVKFIISNLSL